MSPQTFRGLTWDHPRGFDALDAAAHQAADGGLHLLWDKQPLEGFESAPIDELAQRYDLLVIDHPHLGDALASGCLTPLNTQFDDAQLNAWREQSLGNTFASYQYEGVQWALPLDAATQVAASRPDLADTPCPREWQDVPAFAQRHGFCLSLAGPHAFLTLSSLAHAHGASIGDGQDTLFQGGDVIAAWELLAQLHAYSHPDWQHKNPIALLHAMSTTDDVAYCPLVYGYVNYSGAATPGQRLAFLNAPLGPTGTLGSVLGGTGIAITQGCQPSRALLEHLCHLMRPSTQIEFIPRHNGQPSNTQAWHSDELNRDFNGFYANTLQTLQQAFVRPRFAGYTPFQLHASEAVRQMLSSRQSAHAALAKLENLYRSATHQ